MRCAAVRPMSRAQQHSFWLRSLFHSLCREATRTESVHCTEFLIVLQFPMWIIVVKRSYTVNGTAGCRRFTGMICGRCMCAMYAMSTLYVTREQSCIRMLQSGCELLWGIIGYEHRDAGHKCTIKRKHIYTMALICLPMHTEIYILSFSS